MTFLKSTYFSIFFLICFTASFATKTIQNLSTKQLNERYNTKELSYVSHKYDNSANTNDSFFEENENETEDALFIQTFTLPYFITSFQQTKVKTNTFFFNSITEKLTSSIYISVCNFRI
jgi:hypothetical protein